MSTNQTFKLGSCHVLTVENAIQYDNGEKASLQPKFIEVLTYLAHQYPRVVPREELIENIWVGNEYVGEKALTNAIWHLRKKLKQALNDDAIETIRKVGYRLNIEPDFLTEVTSVKNSPAASEPPEERVKETAVQEQTPQAINDADSSRQNMTEKTADESELQPEVKETHSPKKVVSSSRSNLTIALIYLPFVIATVILAYLLITRENTPTHQVPEINAITKLPGVELFASPSPSGQKVVFKWNDGQGIRNLFIKDRNNPDLPPKQLTFGKDHLGHSVWSNSGEYLYFAKKNRSKNYCEIIELKVNTGQEKAIAQCPLKGGYYYIDISPDDKTLAFHGYAEPADDSGIYFIDLADAASKPVRFSCSNNCGYRDRDFKFSPDGKSIAVSRRVNRFDENIYLVDIKTKQAQQITKGEEDIVGFAWHPTDNKLVYAAQRADVRRGYILDLATLTTTKLPHVGFSYPAFATETAELFYQQRSEKYSLVNLTLSSAIASMPFPVIHSEFSHQYPHYSPETKQLAYVSNESGYYELWIADPDGHNRQQLTQLKQTIRYPRWNHAGDKIAFLAPVYGEKADKIYLYDVNTKALSIVKSEHDAHNRPTWSFDDTAIISAVYNNEFTDLYKIDIESGESTRISFDGGRFGTMVDTNTLVYTNEQYGLWRRDLRDGEQGTSMPIISTKEFNTTYSWDLVDTGVYFRQRQNGQYVLAYFDFLLKDISPIVRLPINSVSRATPLNYIEENEQLLFTASDAPQSNIKTMKHPLLHEY
ncbi:MAG: hypothetical protein CL811_11740 [Colwelliaceae bacterium]|nr:hypothetical protein [Colwelliaceae bacterium]